MADRLKSAGLDVKTPLQKIDSSKVSLKSRIVQSRRFMEQAVAMMEDYDHAPDERERSKAMGNAVINFQRYCESVKDILLVICDKQGIALSDSRSLSEAIRKTHGVLGIDRRLQSAIGTLTSRNSSVHDYMNSEYYDEIILSHLTNYGDEYGNYLDIISGFCEEHGYLQEQPKTGENSAQEEEEDKDTGDYDDV